MSLFQCRTQHCVCRDGEHRELRGTAYPVSMPHAALCVSRLPRDCSQSHEMFRFNAARSIVCVETILVADYNMSGTQFQCRTQHCVCRDTVSRSPCPARAEKAFWKDALFCAVFWRLRMNSAPKSGGAIGAVPCAVRAASFWKDETAECGFAPVPEHFPFPSLLIL